MDIKSFFDQLVSHATQHYIRLGIVIQGDSDWKMYCLDQLDSVVNGRIIQLGGTFNTNFEHYAFHQGKRILGQECQALVVDVDDGFDANSFNAAAGTLCGGGILAICLSDYTAEYGPVSYSRAWLRRALGSLIVIPQGKWDVQLPVFPVASPRIDVLFDQQHAIKGIVQVVHGRRKRPLVITAHRGRGKTSALGMAAAELIQQRTMRIVVTAPRLDNIEPVFFHLARLLPTGVREQYHFYYDSSVVQFVAPDELIRFEQSFDLLLVDEAAAIPLAMLTAITERYHRIVFATTVNGYEGCGRGFSLKFLNWLKVNRPGFNHIALTQPIRWAVDDPLERWLSDTFLLEYDRLSPMNRQSNQSLSFSWLSNQDLFDHPKLLSEIFAILVNAHYQTTPNDLMLMLDDPDIQLFICSDSIGVVGCIMSVIEGQLDESLILDISLGKRRPKGQLGPVTVCNQLGVSAPARLRSSRILRIAVHPGLHHQGIGSVLLQAFAQQTEAQFISTSYGVTSELLQFWIKNDFVPVKLGSHRDQSSGCYSMFMIHRCSYDWMHALRHQFSRFFERALCRDFVLLDPQIVRLLLAANVANHAPILPFNLLKHYSRGGANYEAVAVWIDAFVFSDMIDNATKVGDAIIIKVLQHHSWESAARLLGMSGRKEIERTIRNELAELIEDLHCK